jgi:hypothetical protein
MRGQKDPRLQIAEYRMKIELKFGDCCLLNERKIENPSDKCILQYTHTHHLLSLHCLSRHTHPPTHALTYARDHNCNHVCDAILAMPTYKLGLKRARGEERERVTVSVSV